MKKTYIILIALCIVATANAQIVLLNENFTSGLPSDWSVDSAGPNSHGFYFPGFYVPNGNGFDNLHMGVGASGSTDYNDCNLTTKLIDASALSSVYLGYSEQYGSSVTTNTPILQPAD